MGGRSYCDNCKKRLFWFDLIPLFSYIMLRGKCRFCKKRIDPQIFLVELVTALLFSSAILKFPIISLSLIYYLFVISILVALFFIDLNKGIIPDKLLIPAFIISFIYIFFFQNLTNNLLTSISIFIIFTAIYFLSKGRTIGFGDIKYLALLGLIFGFPNTILTIYLAFLTGGIVSLILVLWGKKKLRKDTIAFGPFLSLGGIITLFLGDLLVSHLLSFL